MRRFVLKTLLLFSVMVSAYNGPTDAHAGQASHAAVRLEKNIDVLAWDGSPRETGASLSKGLLVYVVASLGDKSVITTRHGAHRAYLVSTNQLPHMPEPEKAGSSLGKPCPLDPQKRICEVKR